MQHFPEKACVPRLHQVPAVTTALAKHSACLYCYDVTMLRQLYFGTSRNLANLRAHIPTNSGMCNCTAAYSCTFCMLFDLQLHIFLIDFRTSASSYGVLISMIRMIPRSKYDNVLVPGMISL